MSSVHSEIDQATRNKEIIRRCFEEYFGNKNVDFAKDFVHDDFVQRDNAAR